MPALIFEGQEKLKFYTADLSSNTVRVVTQNHETDATSIFCEQELSLAELKILKNWLYVQIMDIENNTIK